MMNERARRQSSVSAKDRLTITLAGGQRRALERIAEANGAPLAFVVRLALAEFIDCHADDQIRLRFPSQTDDGVSNDPQKT